MEYRILYDKVFVLSKPVPIELNGKKYLVLGISIAIEHQIFDANGNEIFYHSKMEKVYNVDGFRVCENDLTRASIKDNKMIIETTDTAKILESRTNQTFRWEVKKWYIDVSEDKYSCITEPIAVSEEFFNDFVKKHIKELTNIDNINAQSCSVSWSSN